MHRLAYLVVLSACATDVSTVDDPIVIDECPGVEVNAPLPSYRGLAGTYGRAGLAPAGEPQWLHLTPARDDPDATGTFSEARTGMPAFVAGAFHALPDNPAIGATIAFDTNGDGAFDETHFVLGIAHASGRISKLCLSGTDHPFLLTRWF